MWGGPPAGSGPGRTQLLLLDGRDQVVHDQDYDGFPGTACLGLGLAMEVSEQRHDVVGDHPQDPTHHQTVALVDPQARVFLPLRVQGPESLIFNAPVPADDLQVLARFEPIGGYARQEESVLDDLLASVLVLSDLFARATPGADGPTRASCIGGGRRTPPSPSRRMLLHPRAGLPPTGPLSRPCRNRVSQHGCSLVRHRRQWTKVPFSFTKSLRASGGSSSAIGRNTPARFLWNAFPKFAALSIFLIGRKPDLVDR